MNTFPKTPGFENTNLVSMAVPMTSVLARLERFVFMVVAILVAMSSTFAGAQTRQWVNVAGSSGLPYTVGGVPRLNEPNPGARGALCWWVSGTNTNVIVPSDTGLKILTYAEGSLTPTVQTASLTLPPGMKTRTVIRTPLGHLFLAASKATHKPWAYAGAAPAHEGVVFVSVDGGLNWSEIYQQEEYDDGMGGGPVPTYMAAFNNNGNIGYYRNPTSISGALSDFVAHVGAPGLNGLVIAAFPNFSAAAAYNPVWLPIQVGSVWFAAKNTDTVNLGTPWIQNPNPRAYFGDVAMDAAGRRIFGLAGWKNLYAISHWDQDGNQAASQVWSFNSIVGNDTASNAAAGFVEAVIPGDVGNGCGRVGYMWEVTGSAYAVKYSNVGCLHGQDMFNPTHNYALTSSVGTYDNTGFMTFRRDMAGNGVVQEGLLTASNTVDSSGLLIGPRFSYNNVGNQSLWTPYGNAEEAAAGVGGFMAWASSSQIYTVTAQGGSTAASTPVAGADRTLVAVDALVAPGDANGVNATNNRALGVLQTQWSGGSPNSTTISMFAVPTSGAISVLSGTDQGGGNVTGCNVVLRGTITGEPYAKVYYRWQRVASGATNWNTVGTLGAFSGSDGSGMPAGGTITLNGSGVGVVSDLSVPDSADYRLLATSIVGGIAIDNSTAAGVRGGAFLGVPSSTAKVALSTTVTLVSPTVNGGAGTSGGGCAGSAYTLALSAQNGNASSIQWTSSLGNSSGGSYTVASAPAGTHTITASYSGASCGTVSNVVFTLNITPAMGALSATRNRGRFNGSTVVDDGVADVATYDSGYLVRIAASATNSTLSLSRSGVSVSSPYDTGSTFWVPRLAAPTPLNPNWDFASGLTAWTAEASAYPQGSNPWSVSGGSSIYFPVAGSLIQSVPVIVDSRVTYLLIAKVSGGGTLDMGLNCIAANRSTGLGFAAAYGVANPNGSYGVLVGPGGTYAFPANTAYAQIALNLPAGSTVGYVRLIPLTAGGNDSPAGQPDALSALKVLGTSYGANWDSFANQANQINAGQSVSMVYRVTASPTGCGTTATSDLSVVSSPRVHFIDHEVVNGATPILVPDPNPANPMVASVCSQVSSLTLRTAYTGNGSELMQWYSSPDNSTWTPLSGANSTTYVWSTTAGTTYFQARLTGGSNSGSITESNTTTRSRSFKIDVTAAPSGTMTASPAVCSGGTITFSTTTANLPAFGNMTWEYSLDNANWNTFSPTLQSGNLSSATFTATAPTVTGQSSAKTFYYRYRMSVAGCSDVFSNGSPNGLTVAVSPLVRLTNPQVLVNAVNVGTTSASVCEGSTVTLQVDIVDGSSSSIAWSGPGVATTGGSATFLAVTGVRNYTATITPTCGGTPLQYTYTITTIADIGTLSVGRTTSTVIGGVLTPSATVDPTTVCSGTATRFTGTVASAGSYALQMNGGGASYALGSGTDWTVPRMAMPTPLNQNYNFDAGNTGWVTFANGAYWRSTGGVANSASVYCPNPTTLTQAKPVIVDSGLTYLYLVAAQGAGSVTMHLDCYANNRTTLLGTISLPGYAINGTWKSYGALVGAGTANSFPANTAYVSIRVASPSATSIDAIRLAPMTGNDKEVLNYWATNAFGGSIGAAYDSFAGFDAGLAVSRSYQFVATANSPCATTRTVAGLDVQAYPNFHYVGYEASVGTTNLLTPDPIPTNVMSVPVCAQKDYVSLIVTPSDTSVPVQWESSPDGSTWNSVAGATGASYVYTLSGGNGYFRLKSAGSGCSAAVAYSRVFHVVVAPAPSGTLAAPSSVCSGATVTLTAVTAPGGATLSWEYSDDNGATWTPFVPTSAGGNNYTTTAPTVGGNTAVNRLYRLQIASTGCTPVWANDSASGIAVQVKPVVSIANPRAYYNSATTVGVNHTVCAATDVTLTVDVANTPASDVTWRRVSDNAVVGTGATYTYTANATDSYTATVSVACGSGTYTFAVTVNPALGAISSSRTVTDVVAGALVHTATVDNDSGCAGSAVRFTATAANASSFTLDRLGLASAILTPHRITNGSGDWDVPRFAASLAVNANSSFESLSAGWNVPTAQGWNVQNMSLAGDTAADGAYAIVGGLTSAGSITSIDPVLVDITKNYLFFVAAKTQVANAKVSFYLDCYQADRVTPVTGGTASVGFTNQTMTGTWASYGGMIGPNGTAFPAGTVYVKVRVVMPSGGNSFLDGVRVIPVSTSEVGLISNFQAGNLPLLWDDMVGFGTGSNVTQTYRITAVNAFGCGTATVNNITATTVPKLVFIGHEATVSAQKVLVPDANPALPMRVDMCGQAGEVVTFNVTSSNAGVALQWYQAVDSPTFTNWQPVASATSASYAYTLPGGAAEVHFKVIAAGDGCGFTPVESRVFRLITTNTPAASLSAPASVCSGAAVALTATYSGGTAVWEFSADGGVTWAPFTPSNLGGGNYTATAPTVTGAVSQTISYRLRVTQPGCGDAYAPNASGVAVTVNPTPDFGTKTINGSAGTTASICPSALAVLDPSVAAPIGTTYQWYSRPSSMVAWAPMAGETNATLNVTAPASQTASAAEYMVMVVSACGGSVSTSASPFRLNFRAAITISQQPSAPAAICSGTEQNLTFSAPGSDSITWVETSSDGNAILLSGLTGPTISVPVLASGPALNADPSFELGVDDTVLARIAGNPGSSVAWDRTNPAYEGSASAKTVGGAITLLHPASIVPVETSQAYLVIAAGHTTGGLTSSLGIRTYDVNGAQNGPDLWVSGATSIALGTSWKSFGGIVNDGTGTMMPVGTTGVRLIVRVNEGGTTQDGHIDDLRIIPIASDELALINARPNGYTISQWWDARAGRDASGNAVRSFRYSATASSVCATASSDQVVVNALPKPYVSQQPQAAISLCGGATTPISATIIGGGTVTWTWQKSIDQGTSWQVISGANASTYNYTAPVVATQTEVQFRAIIISNCGTTLTKTSVVTVNQTPAILQDLDVQTSACSAENLTLRFKGQGGAIVWEYSQDGGAWTVFTPALVSDGVYSHLLPAVAGNAYKNFAFRVIVSSGVGCDPVQSSTRNVSVKPVTGISTQPTGFEACASVPNTTPLAVAADGMNVVYQWQVNTGSGWLPVPGGNTYTITPSVPANLATDYSADYRVMVTGDCGAQVVSSVVTVKFWQNIKVTSQPTNKTIASGQTASFTVVSDNAASYQWQVSPDGGFTWETMIGATSPTLGLPVQTATGTAVTARHYRVIITGREGCGTVTSQAAKLMIYPALAGTVNVLEGPSRCSGYQATMQAAITGGTDLSYSWESSVGQSGVWNAVPAATGSILSDSKTAVGSTAVQMSYRLTITDPAAQSFTMPTVTVTWNPGVAFTAQPQGLTIPSGGNGTITVVTTGVNLSYQWETSTDGAAWVALANNSASLNTGALTATGTAVRDYYYRVTVTGDGCPSVTSTSARVKVYPTPAVSLTSLEGINFCSGSYATMKANVTAGADLAFNWERSVLGSGVWTPMVSTANTALENNTATGSTATTILYRVTVVDPSGASAVSAPVSISWNPSLVVTSQPVGASVPNGGTKALAVAVTGVSPTYQWETSNEGFTWASVVGATGSSYVTAGQTATGLEVLDTYYRAAISSVGCSTVTSASVRVRTYPTPNVALVPQGSTSLCSDSAITINGSAISGNTLSYIWERRLQGASTWTPIPGATYSSLTESKNAKAGKVSYEYRAIVSDPAGQTFTTPVVGVSWNPGIVISAPPQNTTIGSGNSSSVSVTATGVGLTYQWEKSTDSYSWEQVQGATTAALDTGSLVANGTTAKDYYYRVTVSGDGCPEVISPAGRVRVYPKPVVEVSAKVLSTCSGQAVQVASLVKEGVGCSFRWEVYTAGTWAVVSGETGEAYSISRNVTGVAPVTAMVRVTGFDAIGQVFASTTVEITWVASPLISKAPLPVTICENGNLTMTADFVGPVNATVQWQESLSGNDWNDRPGATSTTLTINGLTYTAYYRMKVRVPNCQDVYSASALATVKPSVAIQSQPVGGNACSGDSVTLTVQAVGTGMIYRWEKQVGAAWQSVPGNANSITIPVTNYGSSDVPINYRVSISGDCGTTIVSNVAAIVVKPGFQIITQPKGNTICNNTGASIGFTVNGSVASISWEQSLDGGASWNPIAGATTTSFATGNLAEGQYLYRAKLQGACGVPAYTESAAVQVRPSARITAQPVPVSVCHGQAAAFEAGTNVDATYQWYVSTTQSGAYGKLDGQVQSRLDLSSLENLTGVPIVRWYRVEVRPTACDQPMTSVPVSLTIRPGTALSTQPVDVDSCVNSVATTNVTVTGENAAVTWERNTGNGWVSIPGTGVVVTVPTDTIGTYQVRAVVTGGCGIVLSNPATVKVSGPTRIVTQPKNTVSCEGGSVVMKVEAVGAALSYRWERKEDSSWVSVGASSPSLTVIASRTASYRVTVFGGGGCNDSVVSGEAVLTVNKVPQDVPLETPSFTSAGRTVYLQVADSGPNYDAVTWTLGTQTITGRSAVLQVPAEPGTYTVTVVASLGSCQSVTAWTLAAIKKGNGDIIQNGVVDGSDFARLQAAYGSKAGERGFDAALDLNGDGVIDEEDQKLLVAAFGSFVKAS